jgi:AraC-like DNA-binding protein
MDRRLQLLLRAQLTPSVSVRRWRYEGDDVLVTPAGAHDEVEVAWVERGGLRYRVGSQEIIAGPGDLVIVPSGMEHATDFLDALDGGAVALADDHVAAIARAMGPAGGGALVDPVVLAGADRAAQLARLLEGEANAGAAGAQLAADALSEALTIEVLRRLGAEPPPSHARPLERRALDKGVRLAVEHVRACYREPLRVEGLAKVAGMSRYHFSRRFRAQTGMSPYRFVVETRLSEAESLLRGGRLSVTEAAFAVGFSDLGRFGRFFKRRTGVTPSQFVAEARPSLQRAASATASRSRSSTSRSKSTSKKGS